VICVGGCLCGGKPYADGVEWLTTGVKIKELKEELKVKTNPAEGAGLVVCKLI